MIGRQQDPVDTQATVLPSRLGHMLGRFSHQPEQPDDPLGGQRTLCNGIDQSYGTCPGEVGRQKGCFWRRGRPLPRLANPGHAFACDLPKGGSLSINRLHGRSSVGPGPNLSPQTHLSGRRIMSQPQLGQLIAQQECLE